MQADVFYFSIKDVDTLSQVSVSHREVLIESCPLSIALSTGLAKWFYSILLASMFICRSLSQAMSSLHNLFDFKMQFKL